MIQLLLRLLLFAFLLNLPQSAFGQKATYEEIMPEQIELLYDATTVDELQKLANTFTRISQVNTSEWLPLYYTALAYANMGFYSEGGVAEKDTFFDAAGNYVDQALKRTSMNSELAVLKGYILMGKVSADPANRGRTLSAKVRQAFNYAIQMNAENPRGLILMANMLYNTAHYMGLSTDEACELAGNAQLLFKKEKEKILENTLEPAWGSMWVERMNNVCH